MRSPRHRYATAPLPFHVAVLTVWSGAVTWAPARLLESEPDRATWQAPLLSGVLGLLGAGLAAGGDPGLWWTVAVFLVVAVVGPVGAGRRARTVERLLRGLGPRAAVDR